MLGDELEAPKPPPLTQEESFYWEAWCLLDGDRPIGWSVQRIPLRSVLDYAAMMEIRGEYLHCLVYFVRKLDEAFVERMLKEK